MAALTGLATTAGAGGAAAEQERLQCLSRLRGDLGMCLRRARERCEGEFHGRLGDCFGGPACPGACVAGNDRCLEEPLADRDGCRLACTADLKVALRGCRIADDPAACRRTTRIKSVKCKARCNRDAGPRLVACKQAFDDCLRACAAGD